MLTRLPRLALLQIIHHILQLRQELFRLIARSLTCQIFDLIHHALQILFGQHARIRVHRLISGIRILLLTLGKFTQEILHRLAQFCGKFRNFFLRSAILQCIAQRFLCLAQTFFGCRQITVFNAQCHLPHIICGITQRIVAGGQTKPRADRHETQIMGRVFDGFVRADHQC
ncbi:hypothetical protein D9M69_585450 [compost metagenome]